MAERTVGTEASTSSLSFQDRARRATLRYKTLPTNKKILFLLGIVALIAILIAIFWGGGTSDKILFSNLTDRDTGQMSAALDQMSVPYTVSPGGIISVPEDMVYKVRTQLALQGLPKAGGVGFELLDNQKFGISQFAERVNYQRALEGELSRTVEAFSSVSSARVHIAIPKDNIFLRQYEKTTASVMVELFPGRILDQNQIAGILNLVSSSVPNLNVKDVSIVDQNGELLTKDAESYQNLSEQQIAQVKRLEDSYINKIQQILTPIFGSANVRAQVTVSMDFSIVEQTAETFTPNSPPNQSAIRSRQSSEQNKRDPSANSGVPGALSNQPPDAAAAPIILPQGTPAGVTLGGGPEDSLISSNKEDTTNYELDRTIQHTKLPVGVLKRLTAAVVVNYKKSTNAQTGVEELVPLPQSELQQIENLVKEAIGYSEARSDTVRVVNTAFAEISPIALQDRIFDYVTQNMSNIIKYGLLILLLLYVLFAILRPIINSILNPLPMTEVEYDQQGIPISDVTGEPLDEKEIQRRLYDANLEAARQIVRNDPRMAAQIIREWVGE